MPAFLVAEINIFGDLTPILCEEVRNLQETRPLVSLFAKMSSAGYYDMTMAEWDNKAAQTVCDCGKPECGNVSMILHDDLGMVVVSYVAEASPS